MKKMGRVQAEMLNSPLQSIPFKTRKKREKFHPTAKNVVFSKGQTGGLEIKSHFVCKVGQWFSTLSKL
jgi:hypothetical protein